MKEKVNKKHGRLKKVATGAVALASAAAIGFGGLTIASYAQTSDYSSQKQINEIASELGVDVDNINLFTQDGNYQRLKHNNGEPIYVGISDDFNDKAKQNIQDSLDYVFGIVNPINSDYNYQIVDDISSSKYNGKSTITYNLDSSIIQSRNALGTAYMENDFNLFLSYLSSKPNTDSSTITISSNNDDYYVYVHELLHVFGFDDVYSHPTSTTIAYKNNITQSTLLDNRHRTNDITRYDYAKLMALYTKPFESAEQKAETIQKYKNKIDSYQEYLDDINCSNIRETLSKQKYQNLASKDSYSCYSTNVGNKSESEKGYNLLQVDFDGDAYTIKSLIDGETLVETCTGKFQDFGDIKVLRDVNLLYGTGAYHANDVDYKNNPQVAIVSDVYITNAGEYNYIKPSGTGSNSRMTILYYTNEDDVIFSVESARECIKNSTSYCP